LKTTKKSKVSLKRGVPVTRYFPFSFCLKGAEMKSNLYLYDGPVYRFERIYTPKWRAYTYATSEKQARSNLTFQFKHQEGLASGTKVTLPGEIKLVLEAKEEN